MRNRTAGQLPASALAHSKHNDETNGANEARIPEEGASLEKSRELARDSLAHSSVSTEKGKKRKETYRDWTTNSGATDQRTESGFAHSTDSSVQRKEEKSRANSSALELASSASILKYPEQRRKPSRFSPTNAIVLTEPEQKQGANRAPTLTISASVNDTTALSVSQLTAKPEDVLTFVLDCT